MLAGAGEASRSTSLPVLVQHGTRDPLIDVGRGRESVEQLRQLGARVVYREYEMGHEINAASLPTCRAFLVERAISPILSI